MEFREGAGVYTSTGQEVGRVDRVVIDPITREITHIVIRKGFLLTEDKVAPIEMVTSAKEDRITLRSIDEDLEELPNFQETYYIRADREGLGPRYTDPGAAPWYWYPPTGYTWWGTAPHSMYGRPPYVVRTVRNIPPETVALEEGAAVLTSSGERVGSVERVFADPTDDRATHLLIGEGLLFKKHKLVPTTWISHIKEDQVWLAVSGRQLEALPDYEDK